MITIEFLSKLRADELFIIRSAAVSADMWLKFQELSNVSSSATGALEELAKLHYQNLLSRGRALQLFDRLKKDSLPTRGEAHDRYSAQKNEENRCFLGEWSFECINLLREIYVAAHNGIEISFRLINTIEAYPELRVGDDSHWEEDFQSVRSLVVAIARAGCIPDELTTALNEINNVKNNFQHGWKPAEKIGRNQWLLPQKLYANSSYPWVTNSQGSPTFNAIEKLQKHLSFLEDWFEQFIYPFLIKKWQSRL